MRRSTVFVVDDDPRVRQSLQTLLREAGLPAQTFASGREFLRTFDPRRAGCVVLDLKMPGESGLDVQDELRRRGATLPVIILTAHGSVAASVRALKAGAVEFLEKPAPPATLLERIADALDRDCATRDRDAKHAAARRRLASLTGRERQVLGHVTAGRTSREIALALGISVRTVEGYRAKIYLKTGVSSVAELIKTTLGSH
jgi:FixJ family two-component response regulator